ncbi:ATP synthase subunit I [Aliikangiella sp. IMCC44653]
MSQALVARGFKQAKKLLFIQLILTLVVASLGLLQEFKVAVALLSGGIAVFLANLFFVYKAFSKSGAQKSKQVVRAFYVGEAVKIVLLAGLLVLSFLLLPSFELYVLVGYVAALLFQWLAPVIVKTH